jgi:hypothetical protein
MMHPASRIRNSEKEKAVGLTAFPLELSARGRVQITGFHGAGISL